MNKLELVLERLRNYHPEKIILFGSFGTENADEFSDLDLVVIKNTKERFLRRLIDASSLVGSDIDKVDIFVYTPEEWERMIEWENPFAQAVLKEGKVLYEKE